MKLRSLLLPATLAFAGFLLAPVAGAQQAGNLQDQMSASQFFAAGLNKLSPQELENLNSWLASHAQTTTRVVEQTKVVDSSGEPVFDTKGKREKFETTMVGHFAGFTGASLITLANGQQWQQVGDDKPQCNASDNPVVKVKPSLFGNWLMDVDGCSALVHVKRRK